MTDWKFADGTDAPEVELPEEVNHGPLVTDAMDQHPGDPTDERNPELAINRSMPSQELGMLDARPRSVPVVDEIDGTVHDQPINDDDVVVDETDDDGFKDQGKVW